MECKDFLAKTASKPAWQNTNKLSTSNKYTNGICEEMCFSKMKRVLEILVEAHSLKTNECDEEIYQSG